MLIVFYFTLIILICIDGFGIKQMNIARSRLPPLYSNSLYLERLVERKKAEVDSLLRRHQAADDPLFMRMAYLASECR